MFNEDPGSSMVQSAQPPLCSRCDIEKTVVVARKVTLVIIIKHHTTILEHVAPPRPFFGEAQAS